MDGYTVPPGKSLIEYMWLDLDELVVQLKDHHQDERNSIFLRGQARGLARAIVRMSHPHFPDVQDVSRHSFERWAAHKAGEEILTPGCNKYNPMPVQRTEVTRRKPKSQPLPFSPLSDKEKEQIKTALAGGIPAESLSSIYHCTVRQIRDCA